jgi:hypothetical protein
MVAFCLRAPSASRRCPVFPACGLVQQLLLPAPWRGVLRAARFVAAAAVAATTCPDQCGDSWRREGRERKITTTRLSIIDKRIFRGRAVARRAKLPTINRFSGTEPGTTRAARKKYGQSFPPRISPPLARWAPTERRLTADRLLETR